MTPYPPFYISIGSVHINTYLYGLPSDNPETADIYAEGVPLIGPSVKIKTLSTLDADSRLPYEPNIVPPLSQEYDSGNKIDDIIRKKKYFSYKSSSNKKFIEYFQVRLMT